MVKQKVQLSGWFASMAALLIATIAVAFWSGRAAVTLGDQIRRQDELILQLGDILSTMKDLETGQRGFLLTGKEDYLEPYRSALASVRQNVSRLEAKRPGTPLRQTVELKLRELDHTIELRRAQGMEAAQAIVAQDTGKKLQDDIREVIAGLTAKEEARRQEILNRAQQIRRYRGYFSGTAIFVNLIFLGWMYRKIMAAIRAREKAAHETESQRQLLSTTLASIGDAVIITDMQARITFLNRVAENLTGWTLAEAVGQPCATVFHIINETSREPVESPVDKVLSAGLIVGLANHTLLIRKDGTELPIDDSGAPVREPGGDMRGVVLVFRDFSAYKDSERAMKHTRDELEKASRAKDAFLATLSHELRTPLTPVLAVLSNWELETDLPAQRKDDIQMIRRNVMLEARLIDDLLDLTRISRGTLSLHKERVSLHDLATATVQIFEAEARTKAIAVTLRLNATDPWVFGDPARLQQVLWNILGNAIKFTPEQGRIEISSRQLGTGEIAIQITDTGLGISEKTLSHLFRPFERDTYEGGKFGGLGLGMAISKALVDSHDGSISAQSPGPGQGATFTVTLPVLKVEAQRESDAAPPLELAVSNLRILLVEDHEDTALSISRLLRRDGHEVEIGTSVASALAFFKSHTFDILVSDLGLPDGSGLDVIRHLRAFSNLPAIALTGYGMRENIEECLRAGFQTHLTKPIRIQQLRTEIARIWKQQTDTTQE